MNGNELTPELIKTAETITGTYRLSIYFVT